MFDDLNPNVIVVLVAVVAGGIRWVVERLKGANRHGEQATPSEFEDLYEEARLEILERQGRISPDPEEVSRHLQPATVIRPPGVPPRHPVIIPPPIPLTGPPPIRPAMAMASRPQHRRTPTAEERAAAAAFEARSTKGLKRRKSTSTAVHIRRLLASPNSARAAIVLGDILGPSKGSR